MNLWNELDQRLIRDFGSIEEGQRTIRLVLDTLRLSDGAEDDEIIVVRLSKKTLKLSSVKLITKRGLTEGDQSRDREILGRIGLAIQVVDEEWPKVLKKVVGDPG